MAEIAVLVVMVFWSGNFMVAAGVSNVIVYHGLKLLGPTRVTAFQFLVAALAGVLAAIFLGEAIRPVQGLGCIVILAGVSLLRRGAWPGRSLQRATLGAPP